MKQRYLLFLGQTHHVAVEIYGNILPFEDRMFLYILLLATLLISKPRSVEHNLRVFSTDES